jgi:hypothetical protein
VVDIHSPKVFLEVLNTYHHIIQHLIIYIKARVGVPKLPIHVVSYLLELRGSSCLNLLLHVRKERVKIPRRRHLELLWLLRWWHLLSSTSYRKNLLLVITSLLLNI